MTDFTYKREDKLKKQKLIDTLFHKPKSVKAFPVRAFYAFINEPLDNCLKAGVGCSKKNFKRAVKRNRVKRLLREGWRMNKSKLQEVLTINKQQMLVFFHYSSNELPELETINTKMLFLVKQLILVANENLEKNN